MSPVDQRRQEAALRAANRPSRKRRWPARWFSRRRRADGSESRNDGEEQAGIAGLLFAAIIFVLVLRVFVVEAYRIPSRSMERTLLPGDLLLVNKLVYGAMVPGFNKRLPPLRPPRRNDLIVFDWPEDPAIVFVKRIVGLPGDTLFMKGGILFRDGVPQQEPWALYGAERDVPREQVPDEFNTTVIPAHHFFVLGDNRHNSLDSRVWGLVPDSLVRGMPWVVYLSFELDTVPHRSVLSRIRWSRLGSAVR